MSQTFMKIFQVLFQLEHFSVYEIAFLILSPFFEIDPSSDEQTLNCIRIKNVVYVHISEFDEFISNAENIYATLFKIGSNYSYLSLI